MTGIDPKYGDPIEHFTRHSPDLTAKQLTDELIQQYSFQSIKFKTVAEQSESKVMDKIKNEIQDFNKKPAADKHKIDEG